MVAMCATIFTACSKDDDTAPFVTGKEGVITMTVDEVDIYFEVGTAKADEIITVDWGDGQTQEYRSIKIEDAGKDEIKLYGIDINHIYSQVGKYTIKVTGVITELDCYETPLTTLDVSKCIALTYLNCSMNQLTALNVNECTALKELWCYGNQLTALDVSDCTALTTLRCDQDKLASINVSGCKALTYLDCSYNQLASLDASKCISLIELSCGSNQLASLDVSKCTALTELSCGSNQLTALDVSKCTALTSLGCSKNRFTSTALNKIFTDLPQGTWVDEEGDTRQAIIYISGNIGCDTCNKSIAENKGWYIVYW